MHEVFTNGFPVVACEAADRPNAKPLSLQLFNLLHVFSP